MLCAWQVRVHIVLRPLRHAQAMDHWCALVITSITQSLGPMSVGFFSVVFSVVLGHRLRGGRWPHGWPGPIHFAGTSAVALGQAVYVHTYAHAYVRVCR